MTGPQVINFVVNNLADSIATLVVISIGLALIFGMMGVINLAHGEFIMLGAFLTLTGARHGINIWVSMFLAAVGVGVFGLVVERLIIQHLYGRLAGTLLATWGLSLIMVQAVSLIYGSTTRGIATPLGHLRIGRYSIAEYTLVFIGAAALLLLGVLVVFTKTRYGMMARAAAKSSEMASAVGVNTKRMSMITFAFGSFLAGAAGALLAPVVGVLPNMGQDFVGQAFMTVVVGGPAVLTGTVAASSALGTVDAFVSDVSTPFFGTAAILLVAVLLLRLLPLGVSGRWGRSL